MKRKTENYKRFYIGFIAPLVLCLSYFVLSAQMLQRSGEYLTMDDALAYIKDSGGLYGPAMYETTFWYKKAVYKDIQPDAATVGSSRTLQFRANRFTTSFANIGSMRNLDEVIEITDTLFAAHKPKVLLLGIDFWWFHPQAENEKPSRSPEFLKMRLVDMFEPARWLVRDKLDFKNIPVLLDASPHRGIAAILRGDGFDRFGSYYYGSTVNGLVPDYDIEFKNSLMRIEKGDRVFGHAPVMSDIQFGKMKKFIAALQNRGVHVVMFIPPLAPTALDAMNEAPERYAYANQALQALQALAANAHVPFFNFHDPRFLGSTDCEFLDGIHGGEVVYDRMLAHMAQSDAALANILDAKTVEASIKTRAGYASHAADEIDFMKIGCVKSSK